MFESWKSDGYKLWFKSHVKNLYLYLHQNDQELNMLADVSTDTLVHFHREFRTVKFPYGENSVRWKLRTAKNPYGEISD